MLVLVLSSLSFTNAHAKHNKNNSSKTNNTYVCTYSQSGALLEGSALGCKASEEKNKDTGKKIKKAFGG